MLRDSRFLETVAVGAIALLLTACAKTVVYWSPDGTYTTVRFPVTPDMIWRVQDTSVSDEGLTVYVEVGVCGTPQEQLLPVTVRGAPRGVFRVGQLIALGATGVKHARTPGVRIVSPDEVKQLGCTPANN